MSETPLPQRSLWKGIVAGALAGAVATVAKTFAERMYPPRVKGEPEPPSVLAEKIAGHPLDEPTRDVATEAIHWGFGIATGAFYGALVELYPAASAEGGATFGLTLMGLMHESALPALEVSPRPEDQSPREHTSEAATHVLYGVVTERVRGVVRKLLK